MEGSRIIPGSSTIHFDEISKKQIYQAIDAANFSDLKLIKENYFNLKNKLDVFLSWQNLISMAIWTYVESLIIVILAHIISFWLNMKKSIRYD